MSGSRVVIGLGIILAACASPASPGATPSVSGNGELDVFLTYVPNTGYLEGAIPFVRIHKDNAVVLNERMERQDDSRTFHTELAVGSYLLESYERTCNGYCGVLDKWTTDRCTAPLTIAAGQTAHAAVLVHPAHGCQITFPSN
jgi:hypothetical protein